MANSPMKLSVVEILEPMHEQGWIRSIDLALAKYLEQLAGPDEEILVLFGALVSHQLGRGHPCLDLHGLLYDPETTLALPPEHASALAREDCMRPAMLVCLYFRDYGSIPMRSKLLQVLPEDPAAPIGSSNSPLVLAPNGRLYLRRYWNYELSIKNDLRQRMRQQPSVDSAALKQVLDELFGPLTAADEYSWQRLACALAMRSCFTIVTGGPGTGKTYTVVRLLATLQRLREQQHPLRVRLAAPTGKAAARMSEAISTELNNLNCSDGLKAEITTEAVTLHRLLGSLPQQRGFKHNHSHPLAADVLIIDEASMVDIEMMAAVVDALPAHARLILLGDKDQLASVEAGAVLGQLCCEAEHGHYSEATANWLNETSEQPLPADKLDPQGEQWPYLQHTAMFHVSRRFDPNKGIGKLANEVNQQQVGWLNDWMHGQEQAAAQQQQLDNIELLVVETVRDTAFKELVLEGLSGLSELLQQRPAPSAADVEFDDWARTVLTQLGQFQLLAATRVGEWGLQGLNEQVIRWLHGDLEHVDGWFYGRPVMITQNDYSMNLRNGDMGIVLQRRPDEPLRVVFWGADQGIRWIVPSRLSFVETAYAMTIHKSQGSEFAHTVVVLPDRDMPVLSKELLYTGITRGKTRVSLVCANPRVIIQAVKRKISRIGGL